MSEGRVRWHLDSRLVSYAIAVSDQYPEGDNEIVAYTTRLCAGAALQAASGLAALRQTCESAAIPKGLLSTENGKQQERFATLFRSVAAVIDEQADLLRDLFEMLVVLASNTNHTDENIESLRTWARGIGLDLTELQVHEDQPIYTEKAILECSPRSPRKKISNKPAAVNRRQYRRDRMVNLVSMCVAQGIFEIRTGAISGAFVGVEGKAQDGFKTLIRVKSSVSEVKKLCREANRELRHVASAHLDAVSEA